VADVKAVNIGFLPIFLAGRGSRNDQGNGGHEDRVKIACWLLSVVENFEKYVV
jgi:hypothetical protein